MFQHIFPKPFIMRCMYYYQAWVGSSRYHGDSALTYSSEEDLLPGAIVLVPLQKQIVPAIILMQVKKPDFTVKPIDKIALTQLLPNQLILLINWMSEYYPAPLGQLVSLLLPKNLETKPRSAVQKPSPSNPAPNLPPLTKDQNLALLEIKSAYPKSVLLHGDTGTGKTRVYLELAKEQLASHKSVMMLTPEIGLTPQLVKTFEDNFPEKTVVIHSGLSAAKRRDAWLKIINSDQPLVIIGPRSVLFSPVLSLGLIILDEAHDNAYKQEQSPHYQASRVAAQLANLHSAQLILGSATPLITDYYAFSAKNLPIIRMTQPAKNIENHLETTVIDLKKRENFSKSPYLSNSLIEAIENNLIKKEQSLIFLNRRGTARLVMCQNCGWQALCPRCDLPLTYHGDKHLMQCHTCGFKDKTPLSCPSCGHNNIIFKSIGTKSLVSELVKLFPRAKIQRFDSDTTKSESLEQQFSQIRSGEIDILVGTQVLSKGLDLPKLSLLGIVMADTGLTFPDYTSEEQTFQLLTQVIGRVHRGHLDGKAFIQTHHPDSLALKAAISRNYLDFYNQQINERKAYKFPPFRFTLKLSCSRATSSSAQKTSEKLADSLRVKFKNIEISGPGPAFIEKSNNRYRWQIIIKATQRKTLTDIVKQLPANWSYDLDPVNLL